MKKNITTIFSAIFVLVSFISANKISAQTCNNTTVSYTDWECQYIFGSAVCIDTGTQTVPGTCTWDGFNCTGQVHVENGCRIISNNCVISTGQLPFFCSIYNPPTSTPTPTPSSTPLPPGDPCSSTYTDPNHAICNGGTCGPCERERVLRSNINGQTCGTYCEPRPQCSTCATSTPTPTPTPTPVPCTITITNGQPITVEETESTTITASYSQNINPGGPTSRQVVFSNTSAGGKFTTPDDFSINPASVAVTSLQNSAQTTLTGISNNTALGQITAEYVVNGISYCSTAASVDIIDQSLLSDAWFQVTGGHIISNSDISSNVPSAYSLINNGNGGYPGVPFFGSSLDYGSGTLSSQNWRANTNIASISAKYNFDYFKNKVNSQVAPLEITSSSIAASSLNSGGTDLNGYSYFQRTGDLTLSSGDLFMSANRKVVLLVDGNVQLSARMQPAGTGSTNFLMIIASGNITISPTLTDNANPALWGIYVTDGALSTGAGSTKIRIRGSVFANNVNLERDLGATNSTTAGEHFIFEPYLLLNYPSTISKTNIVWQEVSP